MDGFIFATVIFTSGGNTFLISLIFDSMCCLLTSISLFQFMKADISQLPLLVVLRIIWRSGTCLIAASSGFVTVTIILSTGCRPASAITLILGKVISGNKDVCNLPYTYIPPIIIRASSTASGFLCDIKNLFTFFFLLLYD